MNVIDDEGRLFGVINVIDVLVVLFVVAVVVAGAALVFSDDPEPEPDVETTYATLDLGTHSDAIVEELNEGDTYAPNDLDTLTITELHVTPEGNQIRVIARVELQGEFESGAVNYDGAPPRLGRSLDIVTNRYRVDGSIQRVGDSPDLDRGRTDLVIEDTVDIDEAEAIVVGDEILIDDRPAATVESVTRYGTNDPDQVRVFVGLSVETLTDGDTPRYGSTPIRRGSELVFAGDGYHLDGRITGVGTVEEPGTAGTRTVTLRLEGVRDQVAEGIQPGMTETTGGETIAEITDVETEPSKVVLTSESGDLRVHDDPLNSDVTITAELSIRETTTGVRFKGDSLRQGDRVTLDLGVTTITPTIERIERRQ
ncbi:DUF4330 domain-containing protein [Natronomonas sp.]|uniref:DUF4330 domain-containing protein n=1 Tax=Natronomonas sp. TaxID=2184060 RepID=UPI003975F820